MTARFDLVHRA